MRADRLVAILLMLQRREQVTAAQVAEELEVSERTARRDLDSLAMAGVPVYSQPGRGGGWRLAGGGRIDLSGLTADETRALFLLAGPRAGATPEVRGALRKLVRALPEPLRGGAEAAAGAVVVDPSGWDRTHGEPWPPPLLDMVQAAVVEQACLRITYSGRSGQATQRVVHPLGVASKGRSWYLVAGTDDGMRTFRVDRMSAAERTGDTVERPEGFELSSEWRRIVAEVDRMRMPVVVQASATRDAVVYLRAVFGSRFSIVDGGREGEGGREGDDQVPERDAPDGDAVGRLRIELRGQALMGLAAEIAGFGAMVEVNSPVELRSLLADIGAQLVRTYPSTS